MTNEEKIQELVDGLGIIYTDCTRETIKELLIEMAEWKKKQMIEKMENFVKGLYLPAYPYLDRENSELIEDIKQAMMEE